MSSFYLHDTIWNQLWFRKLLPKQKLLLIYLWNNCSRWGVIDCDLEMISVHIGEKLASSDLDSLKKHIVFVDADKLYMKKFICTQQGIQSFNQLNPSNNAHITIIKNIEIMQLWQYEDDEGFSLEEMKREKPRYKRRKLSDEEIKNRAKKILESK